MAKILAIDYGIKRCGLAETDPMQIIASALDTIETEKILPFLTNYLTKEKIETIVISEPKKLNDTMNDLEKEIQIFIKSLENFNYGIKIARVDERFTSKMAFQTMIDGGMKKKDRQNKAMIDKISATILLQSYLEQKNNNF